MPSVKTKQSSLGIPRAYGVPPGEVSWEVHVGVWNLQETAEAIILATPNSLKGPAKSFPGFREVLHW